jgi:hypothetical protein
MMKHGIFVVIFILTLTALGAAAPEEKLVGFEDRRVMTALRLQPDESINVDGRLDEAVWKRATPAAEFIQVDPNNGSPATEPTEVHIVFDKDRMYMGVICHDSEPDKMMGNTMLRDAALGAGDRFMWVFDPYLDSRSGYFFEINPSGAMGDAIVLPGGGQERAWDGIWIARVVRSDVGWVAEIEVPFRTLNFDPNGRAWGVNFQRTVRRKNEESMWNGHARNQALRNVSTAGLVVGFSEISQGVGLDLKPYLVGSAVAAPGRGQSGNSFKGDSGIDFVYSVTPSLRASFTINTDFAETEVDQRQVNLTRFPLRFPEKREFFLEGSNYFNLSGYSDTFFSRRIGLNQGLPQRIDYGAKMIGKAGAQDLGVLHVRTAEDGGRPGEDFTVLRAKRRFLSESHFGMLYTRRAVQQDANSVSRPDLHTGGFDFRMSSRRLQKNKNLAFQSHYVFTSNPRDTGHSARYGVLLDYPNDLIDANIGLNETQKNFDPAVGFVTRTGIKEWTGAFQFRPRPKNSRWIRQFAFGVNYAGTTDSKNDMLTREVKFNMFQVTSPSGDSVRFEVAPQYERLDAAFSMNDGKIVLARGAEYDFLRYNIVTQTGNNRRAALNATYSWGDYYSGRRWDLLPGLALRPRIGLLIELNGEWHRIELPEGRFSSRVLRSNVFQQFNPWLSVSSNLQYDTTTRVIGWQGRFRWIVKPGNDFYLVYTHNWRDDPFAGVQTVDRKASTKLVYTHRF